MNLHYDHWQETKLRVSVLEVKNKDGLYWHRLSDTIFYPGGGGQERDEGSINTSPVLDLVWEDGILWHVLDTPLSGEVELHVDPALRSLHAVIHSAQHLVCGIINKKYNAPTIAFFANEKETGAEMAFDECGDEILQELEELCNHYILEDLPLEIIYPSLEEALQYAPAEKTHHAELRAVKIGDIDYNLCACIHVPSLRYLQAIKFLRSEKTTRGYRIYFTVGTQLRHTIARQNATLACLQKLLASPEEKCVTAVETLLQEKKQANQNIQNLLAEKIAYLTEKATHEAGSYYLQSFTHEDGKFLSRLGSSIIQKNNKIVFLLTEEKEGCRFFLGKPKNGDQDIATIFSFLQQEAQIRGGGSPFMMQGTANCNAQTLSDLFQKTQNK